MGGDPDSIQSPATAKNVITVGAIEQPRQITNEVWQCVLVDGTNVCQTNQPWLGLTETNNQVAAFSSRGNVGVGIEGDFGRFKPDVVAPGDFCRIRTLDGMGSSRLLRSHQRLGQLLRGA